MERHHHETEGNWPPILTARRVVSYAGRSLTTIDRAVAAGELKLLGRVGGRGERTFRREDVDAWLSGAAASPPALPARRARSATTASSVSALERIAATNPDADVSARG